MRRWICPKCGDGVHAPERPRTDDVRRYCLTCSASTGRLVQRTAPALERERAAARAKAATKADRKRAALRARELDRRTIDGIDLIAEAKRIWNLPTMRELPRWRKELPPIEIRRSPIRARTSGHCHYYSRRVVLTVGTDAGYALEALAHELMHAGLGSEGHSARFWSRLRSVAKEAWPGAAFDFPTAAERGWQLDSHIAVKITEALGAPA